MAVAQRHGGRFPDGEAALLALPGIGAYTAAAIAAIAFDSPATAVDGNVERVVARLFAVTEPLPGGKLEIKRLAATLTPARRPGDYTQAMMDLGATICAPRVPSCALCPLSATCHAARLGIAATLPVKAPKKTRPVRRGTAFVALRVDGAVLLRRRAPKGLLGGMLEVPSTEWLAEPANRAVAAGDAPLPAQWRRIGGAVSHTFTHFQLELEVRLARDVPAGNLPQGCDWYPRDALPEEALPSVMRKVLAHALPDSDRPRHRETPAFL
jgi:A/G-specific adenine glycosylase